ncbi:MAG: energy transducer TonB [Planctomycetes bacterium]|nr:energy transducer TonB [Planctomycetota bacterium]
MSTISGKFQPSGGFQPARALVRWLSQLGLGFAVTVALFTAGLFLGDAVAEMPAVASPKPVPVSDVVIPEPEEEIVEFQFQVETDIPRVDIEMDTPIDVEPPPVQLDFAINPNLNIGIAIPAPPKGIRHSDKIYGVFELETPPRKSYAPPPAYPRNARRLNRQGVVQVKVKLDRDGNVISADLLPGKDVEMFGAATLEAVRKWRFTPGRIGKRPVMCEIEIPVEFTIN